VLPVNEQIIGANIRQLRTQARQTLTGLAQAAGMTKSSLSKIETGRISAPISTMMRIADALGVRLAKFFAEPDGSPPYILTRKDKGRVITRDGSRFGYSYQSLALEMQGKLEEPFILTVRPGDPVGRFQHGGQEFIYVLSGMLEFTVGADRLTLNEGDSLYFDPAQIHTTKVVGKTRARFLCVFIQDANTTRSKSTRRSHT
jgi:transcriptional regulator with XRE-family HTH domain